MQPPSEPAPPGLVLLAAGSSSRMGRPKQLLKLEEESLLRRAALTALHSGCHPIVVVLGAQSATMRPEIGDLSVYPIENPEWERGMGASIRVGVNHLLALQPTSPAIVVMLCDQPFVDAAFLNRLVESHRRTGLPVVASEYQGRPGVPALFARSVFDELRQLDEAIGAKKIIEKYAASCERLPFPEGALDVDTPEDYAAVLLRLQSPPQSIG